MHRPAATVVATLALGLGALGLVGCSSTPRSPTVATTNFSPKLVVEVHGCGVPPSVAARLPACDSGLAVQSASDPLGEPPVRSTAFGTVLLVKNLADSTRRVTGTIRDAPVFDTGQMAPGNSTTIVLDTAGLVTITDTVTGQHTTLTVRPKPSSKT